MWKTADLGKNDGARPATVDRDLVISRSEGDEHIMAEDAREPPTL